MQRVAKGRHLEAGSDEIRLLMALTTIIVMQRCDLTVGIIPGVHIHGYETLELIVVFSSDLPVDIDILHRLKIIIKRFGRQNIYF